MAAEEAIVSYIVTDINGDEYGPVEMEELQVWIQEGRVVPTDILTDVSNGKTYIVEEHPLIKQMLHEQTSVTELIGSLPFLEAYEEPKRTIRVRKGWHPAILAVILSIIPGLGQVYNRQYLKGLTILVISAIFAPMTEWTTLLLSYPLAILDAGFVAVRLNSGEEITDWQWF